MVVALKTEVIGADAVARTFVTVSPKLMNLGTAYGKIAADVAQDAKALVPKVTGRLAADIRASSNRFAGTVSAGGGSVLHAGPINYGWRQRNIEPVKFLNHAVDANVDEAVRELSKDIQHNIDRNGLG